MKVQEVRDAYEYLTQVFINNPAKLLDDLDLTIESDEAQVREAEGDLLVRFLESDQVLLLDAKSALEDWINDVRALITDHAEDSAWLCYQAECVPSARLDDLTNVLRHVPTKDEIQYWKSEYDTAYASVIED